MALKEHEVVFVAENFRENTKHCNKLSKTSNQLKFTLVKLQLNLFVKHL